MKNFFTLTLCFLTLSLTAQEAGCTYQQADNFSPTAIVDDGTCVFGSGLCGEGTYWVVATQECLFDDTYCSWQPDSNSDGSIGITDLLNFLSVFGDTDLDSDGIWDSQDDCVGEYDAIGVCNGDCGEDLDSDLICDDVDECVGEYDECGICNGIGIVEGECDCEGNVLDECGFCGGDGPDESGDCCGMPFSYEGYDYSTVKIGEQCWFQENLRYLPIVHPDTVGSYDEPRFYVLNYSGYDVEEAMQTDSYLATGVLYNFEAAINSCPSGWHMPTMPEWIDLFEMYGTQISDEENQANQICSFCVDLYSNAEEYFLNLSNLSGFSYVNSGAIRLDTWGNYQSSGISSYFHSQTDENTSDDWVSFYGSYIKVFAWVSLTNYGLPLRCIKD